MKLCKDCKWHKVDEAGTHGCRFPQRVLVDVVTGEQYAPLCSDEREISVFGVASINRPRLYPEADEPCGKEARYWEAK